MNARYALHQLRIQWRRERARWAQPLALYTLVVVLFALSTEPNAPALTELAPGILGVGGLMAFLVNRRVFIERPYEQGLCDQWLLHPKGVQHQVSAHVTVQWVLYGLPLASIAPLLMVLLTGQWLSPFSLFFAIALGTYVLSWLVSFSSASLLVADREGILLPLVFMPLYAPVFIFETQWIVQSTYGDAYQAEAAILLALALLTLRLFPSLVARIIRASVSLC